LDKIRSAFPQPVSDRVHDSYFVHSIMRALDLVDTLKSEVPVLGPRQPVDFNGAANARLPEGSSTVEEVSADIVRYFEGLAIWGHPRTQQNVVPPPSISSLIATLLSGLYNPNLSWDEYSHKVALAEVETVAMAAALMGYDPSRASGVFTFGGTGTTLYGVKVGLEKAIPGTMTNGVKDGAVIFASDCSHYCRYNVASWLGLGTKSLITIPSDARNAIRIDLLRDQLRAALQSGRPIASIIATLGSTDAFGLDDLQAIVALRDELVSEFHLAYRPHVHADAVIGWAWKVFSDDDLNNNPLGFRPRTVRALAGACNRIRHLHLADSVGIDFHKTGFTPYISSLFLIKERDDLGLLRRSAEQMPYLYQFGDYRPGMFTLETSRSGMGTLAALANLKLLGKEGLRVTLGHIVEMTQLLREHLEGHGSTSVLNRDNFGTVTLFRAYPDGVDTFAIKEQEMENDAFRDTLLRHNAYNRKIYDYVREEAMAGRGVVISLTECYRQSKYGEPIVALKSFILSPFADEPNVEALVEKVLEARIKVAL
jgi:L-2,4-diaminobutyrate decarboxylase